MMSTEPEILPEAFSSPCASYCGNAENFMMMDEVVKSSLYNSAGYYSENSFDTDSSHHSLILDDPVLGLNQEIVNTTSNYSHQSNFSNNCIQLIVASDSFPVNRSDMDIPVGPLQVKVECADDKDTNGVNGRMKINRDFLVPNDHQGHSPHSSCTSSCSPTPTPSPTPSYKDLVSSPSIDYPGSEEKGSYVRGVEVAGWEEDASMAAGDFKVEDRTGCPSAKESLSNTQLEPTISEGLLVGEEKVPFRDATDSHIKSCSDVLPMVPKRRSHLSHLKLMESPHTLLLPTPEVRKMSDPAIHVRRQKLKTSYEPKRQRCLSDSEAPSFPIDEDELKSEEGCSSVLGCDSGFHDGRIPRFHDMYSSPRVSLFSSDLHSLEDGNEYSQTQQHQRLRRVTPHPQEIYIAESSLSDDQPLPSNPGTMVHPRERSRRSLMKHFSQGSIGGVSLGGGSVGGASSIGASSESPSLSSLLETQSNMTCATDILSSLGFEDFDSPQLVPDRFIPKELEFLRPSSMKAAFIEQNMSPDPPRSPDSLTSGQSSNPPQPQPRGVEASDLPLGATAENFMPTHSGSPTTVALMNLLEVDKQTTPPKMADTTPLFTETAPVSNFTRHRVLETVPEETASDLSLSPRWLSPRVSIDHSVLDLAEGKLGASLQKPRRRSLPTREGYKLSIGSLVESDTGDSIHLSVTSYDDEIAAEREREREGLMAGICDDITFGPGRRRRRGVYTPPQALLSWLSTQKTIDEEVDTDPDELPWPFNEQARLRKSLTEISLAQQNTLTAEDELIHAEVHSQRGVSVSPLSSPNIQLSPQPSLSEVDLDDLEVERWLSPERHSGMTSQESESRPVAGSPDANGARPPISGLLTVSTEGSDLGARPPMMFHDANEQRATTVPAPSPHPTTLRPHRAPITPLNTSRCSLPHLGEGLRVPSIADAVPQGLESPKEDSSSKAPVDRNVAKSNQERPRDVMSPATAAKMIQSPEIVEGGLCSPKKPRSRPRLGSILRQSSFDSDGLPEDMSEIELLTGDLHSPQLTTRKSKASFKRQETVEELPRCGSNRSRSSRRVAMIGEAPSAAELFTSTSLTNDKSEVGKIMVL